MPVKLTDYMEENKFTSFLKKHLWSCLLGLTTVILLTVAFDRYLSSKKASRNQDYFAVLKYATRNQQGEPLSTQATDHLVSILERCPELHPQYDTLLALSFLHQENAKKAIELGMKALERGEKSLSPYFVDYAKTSLLITEEKYAEAKVESKKLEEKLQNEAAYQTLHGFNLLRLAFLGKKLHDVETQKEAFLKLQSLPAYPELAELFSDGKFTLKDLLS